MMDIKNLIKEAHEMAIEKGWWDKPVDFGSQITNIHAELSEVWEDYRNNREMDEFYWECKVPNGICQNNERCNNCEFHKPCGIPIELADILIRIFDTCGKYEIDLERAIELKMAYNKTRPFRHGGKKA